MRTAAAPLMWASAGPCMSKTRLREGDFQQCSGFCLTPLAFASSVGYGLKTESLSSKTKPLQPGPSLENDSYCHPSDNTWLQSHVPKGDGGTHDKVCMPHNDTKESLLFRVCVAVQHLHALLHFVDFFQ